jgi:hypothetical protein
MSPACKCCCKCFIVILSGPRPSIMAAQQDEVHRHNLSCSRPSCKPRRGQQGAAGSPFSHGLKKHQVLTALVACIYSRDTIPAAVAASLSGDMASLLSTVRTMAQTLDDFSRLVASMANCT